MWRLACDGTRCGAAPAVPRWHHCSPGRWEPVKGASITSAPLGEGVPELADPPGQKHPSSPVVNHLAPDSSSSMGVRRSHLGWSRWRLQRKTFTNESLLSCVIIYSITQAREGLRMQKAQSLVFGLPLFLHSEVSPALEVLHCPQMMAITNLASLARIPHSFIWESI